MLHYTVIVLQARVDELPSVIKTSLKRWPQLYDGLEAVRHAFIYGLGTPAQPKCDALRAIAHELDGIQAAQQRSSARR